MSGSTGSSFWHARRLWLIACAVIAALAVAGVGYASAQSRSPQSTGAEASARPDSSVGAKTDGKKNSALASTCPRPVSHGNSCVMSDSPPAEVILRSCPSLPPEGDTTGDCEPIDYLTDGSQVTMRCWVDTSPPPDDSHTSPRWFYVNEVNGPHPGWSGYIYSVLVVQQVPTPGCTSVIIDRYQDPKYQAPPPLQFRVVGSCTTTGGTLTAISSNFTPGAKFAVSATYPNGAAYPLTYTTGIVNANGSVPWQWPCAGDPAGTYHTDLVDLSDGNDTGQVPFTIGSASSPAPVTSPPLPKPSPTSAPPPAARTLDADATPAFGTCPSNPPPANEKYCGGWSNSCASAAFSQANCPVLVNQGTTVDPVCWTTGQTIYNNYSAAAPGANWTLDSDIWIKVSNYAADPWMNELWFKPDNTASNGLPQC